MVEEVNERRKVESVVGRNGGGLKNDEVGKGVKKVVEVEIVGVGDESVGMVMNGVGVRMRVVKDSVVKFGIDVWVGVNVVIV